MSTAPLALGLGVIAAGAVIAIILVVGIGRIVDAVKALIAVVVGQTGRVTEAHAQTQDMLGQQHIQITAEVRATQSRIDRIERQLMARLPRDEDPNGQG